MTTITYAFRAASSPEVLSPTSSSTVARVPAYTLPSECSTTATPTPSCSNLAAVASACSCRSQGGVFTTTISKNAKSTSTITSTVTLSTSAVVVGSTSTVSVTVTSAAKVTSKTTVTTTKTVTSTTYQSGNQFRIRVNTPADSGYDGTFLQASPNNADTGAIIAYQESSAQLFSIGATTGALKPNQPGTDYYNHVAADHQNTGQVFHTILLYPSYGQAAQLACKIGFTDNAITCTSSAGNSVIELCSSVYLRLTNIPTGNPGCVVVTLTAVAPTTKAAASRKWIGGT